MADDEALIKLNVQIADAVEAIKQFKGEYDTAIKQMAEATKAGFSPASAEFQQMRERALAAGRGLVEAGALGRAAMEGVQQATGQEVRELGALDAQLAIIRAQTKKLAEGEVVSLSEGFGRLGEHIKHAVEALALYEVGKFLKESVEAAGEEEDALARVRVSVEATNEVARRSTEQIAALSRKIADATVYDNETILNASNQLLTYTHIAGGVFDRTLVDIADFAAKSRRSIDEVAQSLGKALEDPTKAARALREMGITLTEAQSEALANAHTLAEAQGVILSRVEDLSEGAAQALRGTLGGAVKDLKKEFEGLEESVGQGLGEEIVGSANKGAQALKDLQPVARDVGRTIGALGQLINWLASLWPAVTGGIALAEHAMVKWAETGVGAIALVLESLGKLKNIPGFGGLAASAAKLGEELRHGPVAALDEMQRGLLAVADDKWKQWTAGAAAAAAAGESLRDAIGKDGGLATAFGDEEEATKKSTKAHEEHSKTLVEHKAKAEDLLKTIKALLEAQGAGVFGTKPSDVDALGKQKADLERTVADLQAKQAQGGLSPQDLASLLDAQDKLRAVSTDLAQASLDVNNAITDQAQVLTAVQDPTKQASDVLEKYGEIGVKASDGVDECNLSLGEMAKRFNDARQEMGPAVATMKDGNDAAAAMAQQWTDAARSGAGLAQQTQSTKDAIAGLADRQADFNASLVDTSKQTEDTTKTTKDYATEVGDLKKELESLKKLVKESTALDDWKALVAYVKTEALPVFRDLRDCIEATGRG